jgi:N-methylhydantoinase A
MSRLFLGVDTGGTFTDFVLWRDGRLQVHKVLSTPDAPDRAILQGIRELGLNPGELRLVHGSTVATNAVLEGKGVRTLFVTNRGFGDLLTIGRQNRAALYDLQPRPLPPPVPQRFCHETGGRLAADGTVVEPLSGEDLEALRQKVAELKPRAVAVNLLFSWLDDGAEQAIAAALPPDLFVSLSSRVLPEIREYERGMATWLNAWVGPLVQGYLRRLGEGVPGGRLSVMQSSGDTVAADQAGENAVRMLLSGPAGGLVAAWFVGRSTGREKLLTFDMGGTSTDVALVDGEPRLTREGRIGRWPVAVPMVEMHTIGAGGGSIAWLDGGGMLQVGPESAGADPGPACYGRGGRHPTVTDANLVLGRLLPEAFLGGGMRLDRTAAETALDELAAAMSCSRREAAAGVVAIADEHMARALRAISIQRGVDPAGFTLGSFGGAGGLHVCSLAEKLGMERAMVPVHGGVLSALGMLVARPGRQLPRTWLALLETLRESEVEAALERLAGEGLSALAAEGVPARDCELRPSLDLRYIGQSYTLEVAWGGCLAEAEEAFHRAHRRRYGHRMELPVELVNLRMAVRGRALPVTLEKPPASSPPEAVAKVAVVGMEKPVSCWRREELVPGVDLRGPAIVTETVATTWLAPGWRCQVDAVGNLLLERF